MDRDQLRRAFPETLQENAPLAQYTAARIGGPAEFLLSVHSASELERAAERLWELGREFRLLGGGSNVLVADRGISGVVVLNQAKEVKFEERGVWAESGASIGSIARRAVEKGLSGLEWAATVPGTIGGAIVGNAGAHGGDTAGTLAHAEVIHRLEGRARWDAQRLEFGYRTSWLKRNPGQAVALAGRFVLSQSDPAETRATMEEYIDYRQQTQPTGASIGSMFKNPPGGHAGRLIEAAGLKGERRGAAEISPKHANFFVNHGGASAEEVYALIQLAQRRVAEESDVKLELEVELLGDWEGNA
ncbi:MAG: UDP-N-acetylmuramate dehydrogenase [Anaerolineales bacterium]